jgi:hypothetical protein
MMSLSSAEQAVVRKIFSWLICARRPLKIIELEHALLIDSNDRELQHSRKLVKDIIELCGSVLERRQEYITFVHFSARESVDLSPLRAFRV